MYCNWQHNFHTRLFSHLQNKIYFCFVLNSQILIHLIHIMKRLLLNFSVISIVKLKIYYTLKFILNNGTTQTHAYIIISLFHFSKGMTSNYRMCPKCLWSIQICWDRIVWQTHLKVIWHSEKKCLISQDIQVRVSTKRVCFIIYSVSFI